MRGEKFWEESEKIELTGSPPHARGKAGDGCGRSATQGITPACAGKSLEGSQMIAAERDHPRMRGEKI